MKEKPKTIVQQHQQNFETLRAAIKNNDAALLDCQLKATGEEVAVVVAVNKYEEDEEFGFVPLAMFFNGDPYEILRPPNAEGGYEDDYLGES